MNLLELDNTHIHIRKQLTNQLLQLLSVIYSTYYTQLLQQLNLQSEFKHVSASCRRQWIYTKKIYI